MACLVLALTAASCATPGPSASGGSPGSFCEAWNGLRPFVNAVGLPGEQETIRYLEDRSAATEFVPTVLQDDWDAMLGWDETFVDVLYTVGFDPAAINDATVIQAFGSIEEAEAAEQRWQAAVDAIDRWSAANCAESATSQFTFCERWSDIYPALTAGPRFRPGVGREDAANALASQIADADVAKPDDVPDEWDAIARYQLARHEILVTVGFDESLISDELLADVFGSVAAAREAEAAAAAAVEVVQDWSVTGCGGFCLRNHEIQEALGELGSLGDDAGLLEEPNRIDALQADLQLGDRLVPDELRAAWENAADAVRRWMELWERYGFDPDLLARDEAVDAAVELLRSRTRPYLLDALEPEDRPAFEAWQTGAALPEHLEGEVREEALRAPVRRQGFNEVFLAIEDWVEDNCFDAGGPGIVEVELPPIAGAAGGMLTVVVGEVGVGLDDLIDANRFARGACGAITRSPFGVEQHEDGSTEPVRWTLRARPGDRPDNPYLCEEWADERPLEPGRYALLVTRYPGRLAASPDGASRPSHCLAMEVEVAGNTLVRLPELPLCDVAMPESQQWLAPEPVEPSLPGVGTLAVRFPDERAPEGAAGGDVPQVEVSVVALPAGTTLNAIGREQVAPSAAACVIFEDNRRDPEWSSAVVLPLGPLAPGFEPGCLDALWLSGNEPAPGQPRGEPPAPDQLTTVLLAPGAYDLRLQAVSHGSASGEQSRCATMLDVVVDGDTVVEAPPFEECP